MRHRIKTLGALVGLLGCLGCTTRMVDFTIISTKNIDLSRSASFERGRARIEGRDEAMIIIFIPTGVPSIKEAIDRAIESVPGAVALVDGVVTSQGWWFLIGSSGYVVEGTPLIDRSLASAELASPYMVATLDRQGGVRELRYVSQEEYRQLQDRYITRHRPVKLEG